MYTNKRKQINLLFQFTPLLSLQYVIPISALDLFLHLVCFYTLLCPTRYISRPRTAFTVPLTNDFSTIWFCQF